MNKGEGRIDVNGGRMDEEWTRGKEDEGKGEGRRDEGREAVFRGTENVF
jgi:hypothetical protein